MLGLGIDSVEIARFINWSKYPKKQLLKIFNEQEIDYCLSNPIKSAERFAANFATKEAFFKAISPVLIKQLSFLTVCKKVYLKKLPTNAPMLEVNWNAFKFIINTKAPIQAYISITHTKNIASVVAILV